MTARRRLAVFGGVLSAALVVSVGALALLPAGAATSSAVTKKGTGEFSNLEITVSKTKSLINETVIVSWKGGVRSQPVGAPRRNFLQLMQCWGDTIPDPTQCQFGAVDLLVQSPPFSALYSRLMSGPPTAYPKDPKQTIDPSWGEANRPFLPFRSVTGVTVNGQYGGFSNFFDLQGTNEIPVAPTRADGTGTEYFEIQTATEAPGLGCGKPVTTGGKTVGRSCWLVVVPRSDTEVDGSKRVEDPGVDESKRRLQTSPLTLSNWEKKIVFPLDFQPIGGNCPLNAGQITVLGGEVATEAVARWQSTLCQQTKTVFDFNQVPDAAGRTNLAGESPDMALIGAAMTNKPSTGSPVYAPVAISGLGFAYNIEVRAEQTLPEALAQLDGRRIEDLKLNQRLVAKLLTQSYRLSTDNPNAVPNNPRNIEMDPEFQALNPLFKSVNQGNPAVNSIITPLNPSDANELVWRWIAGDADARDFIAGKPDPNGMVVNDAWKNFPLPPASAPANFPQLDLVCTPEQPGTGVGELCLANSHPYANDMHESVRAAIRGDNLARLDWDGAALPPSYKKSRPMLKGTRAIMVAADSATAARFNLPMVKLKNASGNYVAPTSATLAAGLAAMKKTSVAGVLAPDPNAKGANVYPLTSVSYATVVPAGLNAAARAAYAAFLKYAAGPGQVPGDQPGELPAGYLPLTKAMRDTTKAAATKIANFKPASAKPTPTPKPAKNNTGSNNGGGSAPTPTPGPAPVPTDVASVPPTEPTPTPAVSFPTPTPANPGTTPVVGSTPVTPSAAAGKALLWLLLIFGLAVVGTQALPRLRAASPRPVAAPQTPPTPPGPPAAPPGAPYPPGGDAGA